MASMDVGSPAKLGSDLARRSAPIVGAAALLTGAAFLAAHDPAAESSPFPSCAFLRMTGLWCPGCGLTRGLHELLHGHVGAALSYNVFTPLAAVAIAVAWVAWVRYSWRLVPLHLSARGTRWLVVVLPGLLVLYAVLRNVPAAPLRSLAP